MAGQDLIGVLLVRRQGEVEALQVASELVEAQNSHLAVIFKRPWVSAEGAALANVNRGNIAFEIEMEQRHRIRAAFEDRDLRFKYSVWTVGRPSTLRGIPMAAREGCSTLVVQGSERGMLGRFSNRLAFRCGVRLIFAGSDAFRDSVARPV